MAVNVFKVNHLAEKRIPVLICTNRNLSQSDGDNWWLKKSYKISVWQSVCGLLERCRGSEVTWLRMGQPSITAAIAKHHSTMTSCFCNV
ncbi:uncharacterized [Tachysurus ichikawai]